MEIFKTQIIDIGANAADFLAENMFILFGEQAPPELNDICYKIQLQPIHKQIIPGMLFCINDIQIPITAVGNEVQNNLTQLGHVTVKLDSSSEAELPGTIHLKRSNFPKIKINDIISLVEN